MTDEVTKEDVLAGVQCELESMRHNATDYAQRAIEALNQAADASRSPRHFLTMLSKAFYNAGYARACYIFSTPGSHTENVWTGKVHAYNRSQRDTPNADMRVK